MALGTLHVHSIISQPQQQMIIPVMSTLYRRVQGVLAVSRAFGDRTLKPYVIADPEIKSKKLEQGDDFLIIASDGMLLS
jgi:serine/threonine protein phosphatase PrpC